MTLTEFGETPDSFWTEFGETPDSFWMYFGREF